MISEKPEFESLDVHPTDCALILSLSSRVFLTRKDGKTLGPSQLQEKTIKINGLDRNTNVESFAKELLDKFGGVIPVSEYESVVHLLNFLQNRAPQPEQKPVVDQQASMSKLSTYIEKLYEEIPDKISATRNLMELAKSPAHLEILHKNDALISALSRTLREDMKKSTELLTNIFNIFFTFSNLVQYHSFITSNKIGDLTLKVIEQEIQRYNLWMSEALNFSQEKEKSEYKKISTLVKKQEQLLFVCIHLLLNLAEDTAVEVKMVKRDILHYLLVLLDRKTPELLVLVLTFIKKLVIFEENKNYLLKDADKILIKLQDFQSGNTSVGVNLLVLKIIYNLSFDQQFRKCLQRHEYISRLYSFLESQSNKEIQSTVTQILYFCSVEQDSQDQFTEIAQKIIYRALDSDVNAKALAINIALFPKCADQLLNDTILKELVTRALSTSDNLLLKVLRNLAQHPGDKKHLFLDYIDDFMDALAKNATNNTVLVEIIGVLASLDIPDFDFSKLVETFQLQQFIQDTLSRFIGSKHVIDNSNFRKKNSQGLVGQDDDLLLEVILWIGTIVQDEQVFPLFANTKIVKQLVQIMAVKEEDDEIILQTLYALYFFLANTNTRHLLSKNDVFVGYLLDLLYDQNAEIRKLCDACLDIISETDTALQVQIKQLKFTWHNSEWLNLISKNSDELVDDEEQFSPFSKAISNIQMIDDYDPTQ